MILGWGTPAGRGVTGNGVFAVDDALHAVAWEGAHFTGAQAEGAQAVVDGAATSTSVAELFAQVSGTSGEAWGLLKVLRWRYCRRALTGWLTGYAATVGC